MAMAEEVGGWSTVQGLETLVTQGLWQFEYWTDIRVRGLGQRKARVSCQNSFPPPTHTFLHFPPLSSQAQPSTVKIPFTD